ncbi:MAG: hypothetical protein KDA84_10235, partial [Planctomycetaceae bacterium]|nr:hypothetical protein [Planctomycetaceae bacterium]
SGETLAEPFPWDQKAELQAFLTRLEHEMPVRVGWLAWVDFLKILGGDALTLARARDRFLDRLFARGILPERDLPPFLQGHPTRDGVALEGQRFRLSDFRNVLHKWVRANSKNSCNETQTYVDLILAYGMARQGESNAAKELLKPASKLRQAKGNELHGWCLDAFEHRIQQVLTRDNPLLPLPRHLNDAFQAFSKHEQFQLSRLRKESQILEPSQARDLYREYRKDSQDDFSRQLDGLADITDPLELTTRFDHLLKTHQQSEAQFRLIARGLEFAHRMGATNAEKLLEQSTHLLKNDLGPSRRMELLEKSLRVAAHYDRHQWVTRLINDLGLFLDSLREAEPETIFSLESLAGESFQGMRRFGLRTEMIRLLDQIEQLAKEQNTSSDDHIKRHLLSLQIAD